MLRSQSMTGFDFDTPANQDLSNNGVVDHLMTFPSAEDLSTFTFDQSAQVEDISAIPMHENSGKESTGRWTREEHLLFMKGLELYGKGWKKIAGLIKTRTVVQIRTHAQKYFLKLSKARQNGDHGMAGHGRGLIDGVRRKRYRRTERPLALSSLLISYFRKPKLLGGSSQNPLNTPSTSTDTVSDLSTNKSDSPIQSNLGSSVSGSGVQDDQSSDADSTTTGNTDIPQALAQAQHQVAQKAAQQDILDTQAGLYNFLSPVLAAEVPGGHPVLVPSHTNEPPQAQLEAPTWYKMGGQISNLLIEAECLDWSSDCGQKLPGELAAANVAFMAQPGLLNAYTRNKEDSLNVSHNHNDSISMVNLQNSSILPTAQPIFTGIRNDNLRKDEDVPLTYTGLVNASLSAIYCGNSNNGNNNNNNNNTSNTLLTNTQLTNTDLEYSMQEQSYEEQASQYLEWREQQLKSGDEPSLKKVKTEDGSNETTTALNEGEIAIASL